MTRGIFEMLEMIDNAVLREEKLWLMKQLAHPQMLDVFRGAFDPDVVWLLPEGDPPYRPAESIGTEGIFYGSIRKLYLFVRNVETQNLSQVKRENLFIEYLESLHPKDAAVLLHMKDKKLPYASITPELVLEAFPGLFKLPEVAVKSPVEQETKKTTTKKSSVK